MFKKHVECVVLAVVLLLVIGCGTVIHGARQEVSFSTDPAGAHVTVTGLKGQFGDCETPCTLDLKRKREYKVEITKDGFAPAELVIDRKMSGAVWGNIALGGIIGFIVDFSNGAAYKLKPETIHATLNTQSSSLSGAEEFKLVILDIESLEEGEMPDISELVETTLPLWQGRR